MTREKSGFHKLRLGQNAIPTRCPTVYVSRLPRVTLTGTRKVSADLDWRYLAVMGSDDWRDKARVLAANTMKRFFAARETSGPSAHFASLKAAAPPRYSALAAAFEQNVSAVEATVGIPVTLATGAAHGSHWQRIYSAERIRALMLDADPGEDEKSLEARRESMLGKSRRRGCKNSLPLLTAAIRLLQMHAAFC